jgi:hypothetical protein
VRGPHIREIATDLPTLQEGAACRNSDPDVFFPDDDLEESTYEMLVATAKDICGRCPVLAMCREHGIQYEEYGIWGGMTEAERRKERRNRDRTNQN